MSDTRGKPDVDETRVGYKNPPKHTRFKKGRSGNPKGRPRGHLNLKTDLASELAGRIKLTQDGRHIRLTKQQALIKSLVARAIKGDAKATSSLLALILKVFVHEEPEGNEAPVLAASDEQIIRDFIDGLNRNEGGGL